MTASGVELQTGALPAEENMPNGRTISGTVTGPIKLTGGSNPLTITSTGTVTSTGNLVDAIDGGSGTWTIVNAGDISSLRGDGISLVGKGIVSNSGTIKASATNGIAIVLGGGGNVTNAATGVISGGNIGILAGATATITNYGSLSGATNAGVTLAKGGILKNGSGGAIS